MAAHRILVLSASAGAGHVRAADALVKEFARQGNVTDVQHWDMLKYTTKIFSHLYSKTYLDLINRAPTMLGILYEHTDKPWQNQRLRLAFEKFNAGPFLTKVEEYEPTIIACTHFTPAFLLANLVERKRLAVKPSVVITDFDVHAMWLVSQYEHYFCMNEEAKVYLSRMGIRPQRIYVSGIPVDPVFRQTKDKALTRQKLGLKEDVFTIMVSAGGFGVGPVGLIIEELMSLDHPAQIVAICGRSTDLKAQLDIIAHQHSRSKIRLHPVGFTTEMDEYMAAADILISKPGGLTTSEAMARGLPMCVMNPVPGQEERNSDHLLESGAAIRCNAIEVLTFKLKQLLDNPQRMVKMRHAALQMGRPDAAEVIVKRLLDLR